MRLDILFLMSFLFLIIGLIACSPPPNPTPTIPPTLFPSVTLTTFNPNFVTTLTPQSLPSATILPSITQLDNITVSPPLCYPLESQQVTCLGYVSNESDQMVSDVTLQAIYVDDDNTIQGQDWITLEQRVIQVDDVAPYRIQVPEARLDEHNLQIRLVVAHPTSEKTLPLQLLNMQGAYHLDDNRYEFVAELENPTAFIAINTRLVVTLENSAGDIIGYRVADVPDELPSGDKVPIRLLMTPLEATTAIRHRITLEAFPSDVSPTPEG